MIYLPAPAMSGSLTIQCAQINVNVNNYYIMPSPPTQPGHDDVDSFNWDGLNFDNLSFDFDEDDATSTQFSSDEGEDSDDSLCSAFTGFERMTTPFERRLASETGSRSHSISKSANRSQSIVAPTPAYGYDTPLCKFLKEWNSPSCAHSRYHPYSASVSPRTKSPRASSLPLLRHAIWSSGSRYNPTRQAQTNPVLDDDLPCSQGKEVTFVAVSNVYSEAPAIDFGAWPRISPSAISTYSSLAGALGDSPVH
ncbi:hypothetical protein EYR40_001204 [Pleurotus pulmonarius]|nr:hypothetical protein EYR36_000453 [Pleurotus pulmonarius]KAF4604020.1 hypothetical protein EYR38_004442 [Pleurotus pulmonarius]KAF4608851.1 hypothetical protein EYR40_001204 [Pleurotus pulmonarius]